MAKRKKQNYEFAEFLRMWHLLSTLETAPRFKTVRDLSTALEAEGLEVTDRTIQRILKFFEFQFDLVGRKRTSDRGHPYEWAWPSETGRPTIGNMDPATAITYEMAGQLASAVLPRSVLATMEPDFRRARKVLLQSGGKAQALSRKIRIHPRSGSRLPAEIAPLVLTGIHDALMRNRKAFITYRPLSTRSNQEIMHEISPLGIVSRFDTLYLIHVIDEMGNDADRSRIMAWPMHRFTDVRVIEGDVARAPEGFDLDQYIRSPDFLGAPPVDSLREIGATFKLKILAKPHTAKYIQERPFGDDQMVKKTRDGRVRIEATVNNTRDLLTQLHDFADDIEVLSPKEYRAYFKELSTKLTKIYS